MKLYLISQDQNNGYGTYDSAVVAAESRQDAMTIYPSQPTHVTDGKWIGVIPAGGRIGEEYELNSCDWIPFNDIHLLKVQFLGSTTRPRGVILASYNAG